MKFFKRLFLIGGTALAGYLGFKLYKIVSNVTKLHKTLPEFLCNVYGEKPTIHINHNLKTAAIKVGFSKEIIDKHTDIENTIREYVDDFYPDLAKNTISIEVFVKSEKCNEECEEEETEEAEEDK